VSGVAPQKPAQASVKRLSPRRALLQRSGRGEGERKVGNFEIKGKKTASIRVRMQGRKWIQSPIVIRERGKRRPHEPRGFLSALQSDRSHKPEEKVLIYTGKGGGEREKKGLERPVGGKKPPPEIEKNSIYPSSSSKRGGGRRMGNSYIPCLSLVPAGEHNFWRENGEIIRGGEGK